MRAVGSLYHKEDDDNTLLYIPNWRVDAEPFYVYRSRGLIFTKNFWFRFK